MVVSTSLRKDGNSHQLACAFAKGAEASGNEVELVSLRGKTIGFCKGCLACQKTLRCAQKDDANGIVEKMLQADVLAFATPIYYYSMCGQMKTLLDRANPLYSSDYRFRKVYLLATAADEEPGAADGAVEGLNNWLSCFEKAGLSGSLFCGGVTELGDIEGNPAIEKAYQMGQSL